jgi:hypothetical protein
MMNDFGSFTENLLAAEIAVPVERAKQCIFWKSQEMLKLLLFERII